jgi:RNA polymerase sigma-70 factor (ECF subfamily)
MYIHSDRRDLALDAPDSSNESRDRAWIARVRASDAVAFESMFRVYGEALCAFVSGYVRSRDEAQELVQDLFLWIWEHRYEWEVPGSLRNYLFKSARNRAISWLRHRQIEQSFRARALHAPDAPQSAAGRTDQRLVAGELALAIDRAIAQLPERCQEVFRLNRQQGLSYAEIAALLDLSVKTVEVHMGRALATLREHLAEWRS